MNWINRFKEFGVEVFYGEAKGLKEELEKKGYKIIYGHQTHSSNVKVVEAGEENYFEECDGFITDSKQAFIYTKYADCLPIYFFDPVNQVIGLSHSGWKGTLAGIGKKTIHLMEQKFGTLKNNILVGLGPSICKEHYEVSEEFIKPFKEKYGDLIAEDIFFEKEGKYFFDNKKLNQKILIKEGIKDDNIFISKICTYEQKELNSYRRDREKSGRDGAFIYFSNRE
jgi:hypothetical protein